MSSSIKICINTGKDAYNCIVKLKVPPQYSDISIRYGKIRESEEEKPLHPLSIIEKDQSATIDCSHKDNSSVKYNSKDREIKRELIFNHIKDNNKNGCSLPEIRKLFPRDTKDQVQHLLRELKANKKIISRGRGASARWRYKKGKIKQ